MRVLSIQSHVVHGHVGNKSAVFPLQLLGFEVDAVNTVQFSNHTGYDSFKGKVLDADGLWDLIEGLQANGLLDYTHLLTGYMGSAAVLKTVVKIAKRLKELNPSLVYVCDPVLGDNGKLYVPEELVGLYEKEVVPLADILTPNQFEVEQLTGSACVTEDDVCARIQAFHERGVGTVVVTSFEPGIDSPENDLIRILGSTQPAAAAEGALKTFSLSIPRMPGSYTGTGDLFAALLLAWMEGNSDEPHVAVEKTAATLQAVIRRTLEHAKGSTARIDTELRLIQSKSDIENPEVVHRAVCSGEDAGVDAAAQ